MSSTPSRFASLSPILLAAVAAADSTPPPPAGGGGRGADHIIKEPACTRHGMWFRPVAGARYEFSTDEVAATTTPRKPYRSSLVFGKAATGWKATETDFSGPGAPSQTGNLPAAVLLWALDNHGVPTRVPDERGGARPDVLPTISLFAFRPVGVVIATTCVGDRSETVWTDSYGRVRSVRYRIVDENERRVRLHIEGTVKTRSNVWDFDGEMDIDRADGFSGETRLHQRGPGAPQINDSRSVIRVARVP